MTIQNITFKNFNKPQTFQTFFTQKNEISSLVDEFCANFSLPNENRNYSSFDEKKAAQIANFKDKAIIPVTEKLQNSTNEKDITAGLFLLNRIYDAGAEKSWKIYPIVSKFNYSDSPNVQVMLAGVYRKIQVPDAFGPLVSMFLKNSQQPITKPFDPNEEVGGAILEYLRNTSASENYKEFSV